MIKRILVYGDSNTWGSDENDQRYATEFQWPMLLQQQLGGEYDVIQEGLCGRIAGDHDNKEVHRNGRIGYEIAIRSASPFDYLIVALGSNDLKHKYRLTAEEIVADLLWYKQRTESYNQQENDMERRFKKVFYLGIANFTSNDQIEIADGMKVNEKMKEQPITLIDLHDLEHSSDGLHYSKKDHAVVAREVFNTIREYEHEV